MNHGHPIRVAVKRTGMSPHLIRMWERRYSAVEPRRTDTGRRLYTEEDIERLALLRQATLEGQSIGQIARLSSDQLRALIGKSGPAPASAVSQRNSANLDQHIYLCLEAMKNLDAATLEARLLRASVSLGQQDFLEKLLHPLLEITGEMWSDGRLKVAHEHLASGVVRSLLGSIYLASRTDSADPLLVSATPRGQLHEFGALMASVTAAAGGWRTLYLGPNMPAEDLVEAVRDRQASAAALSIVYPANDPYLAADLRKLRALAGHGLHLLVGGRSASSFGSVLDEIGAIKIISLADLREELERLKPVIPAAS